MDVRAKYQCKGKNRYTAKEAANVAAKLTLLGTPMEAYPCPHCGNHHVGTPMGLDRSVNRTVRELENELFKHRHERYKRLRGVKK